MSLNIVIYLFIYLLFRKERGRSRNTRASGKALHGLANPNRQRHISHRGSSVRGSRQIYASTFRVHSHHTSRSSGLQPTRPFGKVYWAEEKPSGSFFRGQFIITKKGNSHQPSRAPSLLGNWMFLRINIENCYIALLQKCRHLSIINYYHT